MDVAGKLEMQASPVVLTEDVVLVPLLADIATRLADEGVPVYAIARALQVHPTPVREAINTSIYEGRICDMPREDWPPGITRHSRLPVNRRKLSDEEIKNLLRQTFGFTRTEALMFLPLFTRPAPQTHTKEALHHMAYSGGADGGPEIKIVDVLICKVRKKFAAFGIDRHLVTVWGTGYKLTAEGHDAIEKLFTQTMTGEKLAA